MGREIRMVPPHWEHPKIKRFNWLKRAEVEAYQPMYDRPFAPAMREWYAEWEAWERGERPTHLDAEEYGDMRYWEWSGGPPDPNYYRPEWPKETRTWVQVYETISEGTPVTPPFATRQELVEYLVSNGDFWDQRRRAEGDSIMPFMPCDPWARAQAEAFVFGPGWAPSVVVSNGVVMTGVEAMTKEKKV